MCPVLRVVTRSATRCACCGQVVMAAHMAGEQTLIQ